MPSRTRSELVPPDRWAAVVSATADQGYGYFDWLGCLDDIGRADTLTIVLQLRDLNAGTVAQLRCPLPRSRPRLASIRDIFAGAGWHEREAAELFGVEFLGGERRRLLLEPDYQGTPLLKDEVLGARAAIGWPGAKEPGESVASPSRRRMVPPGVPDPSVWGDRDPAAGAADPAEIAAAVAGGRVRRRRDR